MKLRMSDIAIGVGASKTVSLSFEIILNLALIKLHRSFISLEFDTHTADKSKEVFL